MSRPAGWTRKAICVLPRILPASCAPRGGCVSYCRSCGSASARAERAARLGAGDKRAQRARLVFDLVEPVLDHVADTDDAAEEPILHHRKVANTTVGHFR